MTTIESDGAMRQSCPVDTVKIEIDIETRDALKLLVASGVDVGPLVRHAIRRLAHYMRERESIDRELEELSKDPDYLAEVREVQLLFGPLDDEG